MTELIKYNAACKAIAEAKRVDEIKLIHDKADALRAAAKIAKNHQAEIDMAEIRFRAEIRLGELLQETPRVKRGANVANLRNRNNRALPDIKPTLKELGIDVNTDTYRHALDLSRISKDKKEKAIREWRQQAEHSNKRLVDSFYNSLKPKPKPKTIDHDDDQPDNVVPFNPRDPTPEEPDYVIVRCDRRPSEWWDGCYCAPLAKWMAEYWSEELGVRCYVLRAVRDLPESGFHTNVRERQDGDDDKTKEQER